MNSDGPRNDQRVEAVLLLSEEIFRGSARVDTCTLLHLRYEASLIPMGVAPAKSVLHNSRLSSHQRFKAQFPFHLFEDIE